MDLSVLKQSDVQIIRLRGRLNLGDAVDSFRDVVERLLEEGEDRILVNLSEVPLIDSSGIGALVRFQTSAKASGGSIKLVQPSVFVRKTLKMVGLLDLFETFDDEATAAASFEA